MDPYLTAVGLIGGRELTDELLNEVLTVLRKIAPHLTDAEVLGIRRQLESTIGVSMSAGQGLHGNGIVSWLPDLKASTTWTHWDAYVQQLKSKSFGQGVIRVLDEDTDNILNECGNPLDDGPWTSKGLVMGDVQSGKTASYCGLISKAGDAGYKVIVLLTGMIEDLRAQSQERLDEGFVGRDSRELLDRAQSIKVIGAGRFKAKAPNVLTSISSDFLKANYRALGGIPLENIREPVLLVMKKNVSPLTNLVGFLDSQMRKGVKTLDLPLLIVDDEADNASVNGRTDESPAAINKLIREVRKRFSRSSYVGYTATPFANVFIDSDVDEDLFPSNFVYSLNTPSNYLGVAAYFADDGSHAFSVRDIDDAEHLLPYRHRKDLEVADVPQSLKDAISTFLLSCAIRDLRAEPMKHRSMLVNASRFTDVQARIAEILKTELYELVDVIKQYLGNSERWEGHPCLNALYVLWNAEYSDCGFSWDQIREQLYESVSSIKVVTINQKSDATERLNYTQYNGTRFGRRVIAVGGLTLSRGLTLEGLCVSYFYRNSKAYDTLLQMGRWFGYRPGYDDLCRIWVDPIAQGWYRHLTNVVDELRRDIRRMHANNLPPSRFGMRIRSHPNALIVTALNKMRHASQVKVEVSYSAFGAETPLLPLGVDRNHANLTHVVEFIEELGPAKRAGNRLVWEQIGKQTIARFLEGLDILDLNIPFMRDAAKGRPLLQFIELNSEDRLEMWDVCLPQGEGIALNSLVVTTDEGEKVNVQPRGRQFERVPNATFLRINKQRVGDVSDELVGLSDDDRKLAASDWEDARARDKKLGKSVPAYFYRRYRARPILTIHVIEPVSPPDDSSSERRARMLLSTEIESKTLVAVTVSFPEFDGVHQSAVYALNKVALRESGLLDEEDDEDED